MKVAIIINIILIHQSIIAINAASLPHTTDTNNNKSKHINQYYKRRSYQWNANLHRQTGIATSFEQSIFHNKHQPPICSGEDVDGFSDVLHRPSPLSISTTKKEQIKHTIQDIFSSYPNFLSKPSLTFGLCRSIPSDVEKEDCNLHLQTSFLHLNVLIFGKPRIVKPKHHIVIDNKAPSIKKEVVCCIEIPIEGGLLAIIESKSTTTKSKKKNEKDHGCLRFTWLQTKQPNKQQQHTKKHKEYQQPEIILITEIRGKYRPTLAGNKLPISNMRKVLYYSTQRMVHTYVMWRYHDYVVKEYSRRIDLDG